MKIHDDRKKTNEEALAEPRIGDYWHEMFCPYFCIVNIKDGKYTILNFIDGRVEYNAKIDNNDGTWSIDYTKTMVVDHAWIKTNVTYQSISGFVADVVRDEGRGSSIVNHWRDYMQKKMRQQIEDLTNEWEEFTGWSILKE